MTLLRPAGVRPGWLGRVAALALCVLLVACGSSPELNGLNEPPLASQTLTEGAFVWPLSGWITAADSYWTGRYHTLGTADITAPYWQPVGAARAGTVTEAGWSRSPRLGFYVKLDHGGGYETLYAHLVDTPKVKVGDVVKRNRVLGHNGRTGNAGLPHVHFTLLYGGAELHVPGLAFGAWATKGALIPGDYPGLSVASPSTVTFAVKVIVEDLPVKQLPTTGSSVRGRLSKGTILKVSGGENGFYLVTYDGAPGYIVSSGTVPAASRLFGVRTVSEAAAYAGPEDDAPVIATFPAGTVLSAFGTANGRYQTQWRDPYDFVQYVWVPTAAATKTARFWVRGVLAPELNVRSGPGTSYPVVRTLTFSPYKPEYLVTDNVRGWYKIGPDRWVPGWQTVRR